MGPDGYRQSHCSLLAILVLLLLTACQRGEPRPVDIVLDEDSCAVCRMAVSQQRFAAEIVKRDGTALYFDDIGCLVEMTRDPGIPDGAAAFVVDFNSNGWLEARTAQYLHARTLPSPMSYGLGAFASTAEATAAGREWPGKVMGWEQLIREWQP